MENTIDDLTNEVCIGPDESYIIFSSDDPSNCFYFVKVRSKPSDEHNSEENNDFFRFDKEYLVDGIEAALASGAEKTTITFRGHYVHQTRVWSDLIPNQAKPEERELDIYLQVDLSHPNPQFTVGEVTADYLEKRLAQPDQETLLKVANG